MKFTDTPTNKHRVREIGTDAEIGKSENPINQYRIARSNTSQQNIIYNNVSIKSLTIGNILSSPAQTIQPLFCDQIQWNVTVINDLLKQQQ